MVCMRKQQKKDMNIKVENKLDAAKIIVDVRPKEE